MSRATHIFLARTNEVGFTVSLYAPYEAVVLRVVADDLSTIREKVATYFAGMGLPSTGKPGKFVPEQMTNSMGHDFALSRMFTQYSLTTRICLREQSWARLANKAPATGGIVTLCNVKETPYLFRACGNHNSVQNSSSMWHHNIFRSDCFDCAGTTRCSTSLIPWR